MAAPTVFATVSCSVKPLLLANGKRAKTACWMAGCCAGTGESLLTWQVSHRPVIRMRLEPSLTYGFLWC